MSNNKKNKEDDLKALESLENESKNNNSIEEENDFENQEENPSTEFATDDTEDILLGYKQIQDIVD